MGIATQIELYRVLRSQTAWSLLAADTGPETLAYLQALLFDSERSLPNSVFIDRLHRLMNQTSSQSVEREAAAAKVTLWRQQGYVVRSLSDNDSEPVYELSVGAFEAIRFVSSQSVERTSPTESRLEILVHAVKKLVDDTDTDVSKRIARLRQDKKLIDQRIQDLRDGRVNPVSESEVKAEVYDILSRIEDLDGDFLRVRNAFHALAEKIQADVMNSDATRGKVIEQFFAGYDSIAESEAGRTFSAFYRFLSSELATREIDELVQALSERAFWDKLDERSRESIGQVEANLSLRARETQAVMKRLATSLRYFVQSREYQQNRRLTEMIDGCRKLSLSLSRMKAASALTDIFGLQQSFATVQSAGALALYDPQTAAAGGVLTASEPPLVDLAALAERLAAAEINYAGLKANIEALLEEREFVSIADVLQAYPARQGLASIIGYIHLAVAHAERSSSGRMETLAWENRFGEKMRGKVPLFLFRRGCLAVSSPTIKAARTDAK